MRTIVYIALFTWCFCISCTVKRDNPLDLKGTISNNSTSTTSTTSTAPKPTISFSRYTVVSDNNDDEIVNPGETIGLQIFLKNNGSEQKSKIKATITCSSSFVSSLMPTTAQSYKSGYYNDYLGSGVESTYGGYPNTNTLTFKVANTTPAGTVVTFKVSITDGSNNSWTDSFNVQVQKTGGTLQFSRYEIASDNNSNEQVNKGETIGLRLYLKNMGSSQVNKVKASITCNSSYVSGISPTTAQSFKSGYYNDYIPSGTESTYGAYPNTNTLSFTVSNSAPTGTILTFNITITDESNNTWTDTFSLTVVALDANIKYSRNTVSSDNNSNEIINPGENIGLQIFLKNIGSSQANKIKAVVSCSNSYVTNLTPATAQSFKSGYYNDYLPAGTESTYGAYPNSNTVSFKVASSTPTGTVLNFSLSINDESNNTWTDNFSVTVY